jgi:hypothetical protein
MEVNTMVERTKAEFLEEFEGKVENVTLEPSQLEGQEQMQYHIEIVPSDSSLLKNAKTGRFHEWIRVSATATDETVPEGSVADKYIQEIELLMPSAKKCKMLNEVFLLFKGHTFLFKRKKLGKSYAGHEAKEYWTPVKLVK